MIASRRDWEWTEAAVREHRLDTRFQVLVSGVFGAVDLKDLAEWVLTSRLTVRMQLQMHKYIWGAEAQGV